MRRYLSEIACVACLGAVFFLIWRGAAGVLDDIRSRAAERAWMARMSVERDPYECMSIVLTHDHPELQASMRTPGQFWPHDVLEVTCDDRIIWRGSQESAAALFWQFVQARRPPYRQLQSLGRERSR